MKKEATKEKILQKALELFSTYGYDAVSVGTIADAVGIKAPSLYNHFESKKAIFDAIVEATATQYEKDTAKIDIHVADFSKDVDIFKNATKAALFEKVEQIFDYSIHNEAIARFRRMLTIEQFRSAELSTLFTQRYFEKLIAYHAELFKSLIASGIIKENDPRALALMYVSPILTLISVCDRHPEKEAECKKMLASHVGLFFDTYSLKKED